MIQVTYNFHSCFTVELDHHVFIFDYFNPEKYPRGAEGNPMEMPDTTKDVYVFSSHRHQDHFSEEIFRWRLGYKRVRYVISNDIHTNETEDVFFVGPNSAYSVGDIRVSTLNSTDEGVAFLIEAEGKTIYHAGDLHWWYWEEKGPSYIKHWGDLYKKEIDLISDKDIDIAFVVLDPRMGAGYDAGMIEFLERVPKAKKVFPMHLWKQYALVDKFMRDTKDKYKDRIIKIEKEGQKFLV